jgi:hypothetical protein
MERIGKQKVVQGCREHERNHRRESRGAEQQSSALRQRRKLLISLCKKFFEL